MINAVIFDMDGVIVDSEPFWQKAEREVFTSLGVEITDELRRITQRMTTNEVTRFWFKRNPWKNKGIEEVENMVIDRVIELIELENCLIPGVVDTIKELKSRGVKLALATNSPYRIIPKVLNKMNIIKDFETISSAEFEKKGKPEPYIYLSTLQKLNEKADNCIVIEDSNSGIIAANKAGIKVIAFTNGGKNLITENFDFKIPSFENVDYTIFESVK
ncbi:HAD family phosphatase [Aquimarina sp. BL5]|uniref:HAD family hydrolase n=1 Tax=Aquimarina sp. BL5 TaxID=1714860 RepID=UPI001F1BF51E|nr:HAD-IA family hydrolase [Aquimarina sp. BL5]